MAPINSRALSAFDMGQPTALSNTANLLRICICKECDHRYSNDGSAQKRLDRYDLFHGVALDGLQGSKWSGSSALCRLHQNILTDVPASSGTQTKVSVVKPRSGSCRIAKR